MSVVQTHIKRLDEERKRAWEEAEALLDKAESEKRDLTAEESETFDTLNADIDARAARIRELDEAEKRNEEVEEIAKEYEGRATTPKETEQPNERDSLLAFFRGEPGSPKGVEVRDLTKGTAAAGGNTVPTSFRAQLYEHLIDSSAIRQTNVTVLTTDSGEDLQIPKTTSYSTASLIAEGAAITESDPAFGQVTLQAFKYAILIQTGRELIEDTAVDLLGFIARQAGRALGDKSGEHFVTGTGSSQPNGIVTASSVGRTGATGQTTSVTTDDLMHLYHSVIQGYRRNAFWLMHDSTAKAIRMLKDTTNQYLWQPGLVAGQPDTLLSRPVVTDPNVAAMAASAKSILFGDCSGYFVRDVAAVRFERSDDFAFANDLVTFRAILRTDGDLVDTNAVKHYANSAT